MANELATRAALAQSGKDALLDFFDRAASVDLAVLRRGGIFRCGPIGVVAGQRAGLRVIDLEPVAHDVSLVVFALYQRLAGRIVAAVLARRIELHVICAPA